jgi:acylphosphatase
VKQPEHAEAYEAMSIRRRFRLYGTVQGVGFRWFVQSQARELDIMGWVKNCADGSVLMEAEAEERELAQLLAAVRAGPRHAQVVKVVEEKAGTDDLAKPFAIVS